LGLANSLPLIYLSRIVDGLIGSNHTITQAYVSDITKREDRSKVYGIMGIAFGVGFLLGPGLGGVLASNGHAIPSFLAAFLVLLSIVGTMIFLPETVHRNANETNKKVEVINFRNIYSFLKDPSTGTILISMWLFITATMMLHANMSLFVNLRFGLREASIGLLLTYVGFLQIVNRGLLLPKFIKWFGERKLSNISIILMIVGFYGFMSRSPILLITSLTAYSIGSGLLRPLMMGELSRSGDQNKQGALMGVNSSLGSISQIFAPAIGGIFLSVNLLNSLVIFSSFFIIGSYYTLFRHYSKERL
jgi:MFS family permease